MSQAKIIDVSWWQGPTDDLSKPMNIDIAKTKAAGVDGVIARIGSINDVTGVCYLDNRVLEIFEKVSPFFPMGVYFYSRPKFSGKKQGDFVLEQIHKYGLPIKLDVWNDVEQNAGSVTVTTASVKEMTNVLLSAYPKKTAIYTRETAWDAYVAADPLWSQCKLVAARYPSSPLTSPWSDGKYIFRDWTTWKFWQFTDAAPAVDYGFLNGGKGMDVSWYNGAIEAFKQEYGLDPVAQEIDALKLRATALEGSVTYLDKQITSLSNGVESLKAADEQIKNRVMSAEVAIDLVATRAYENKTWLQKLDAWARTVALK